MTHLPSRLTTALSDRYRIERELGAGGMATVYLAEDLKHDRRVAIKVLKPELAAVIGGERFLAEIKTTANLQHPHILPLFDSGEADGFLYYVMPYVDGESLRDRLDREKQLPVDAAVGIAAAVASALHYAHQRALAISTAGGDRLTDTGMSVGTPHYMSPEQASADRGMDARSDLYSLACVLYEMLAGDPPHAGSTARAVLMRILTEEPRDVTDARSSVPAHVRDALRKAMEKLPADRFTTAAEFGEALQNPTFRHGPDSGSDGDSADRRERPTGRWVGSSVAAALFIGGVALGAWRPWQGPPVTRLTIGLPPGQAVTSAPAVSPDGRTVAYTAGLASEAPRLFLRERLRAGGGAGLGGGGVPLLLAGRPVRRLLRPGPTLPLGPRRGTSATPRRGAYPTSGWHLG
jgi:serine/threonine-protein kinase